MDIDIRVFCEEHLGTELDIDNRGGRVVVSPCPDCLRREHDLGYNEGCGDGYDKGYEAGTFNDDGDLK